MYRICKIDEEKRMVTGEVYAPFVIDSHGDMMLPEDIELMAHRFLEFCNTSKSVDTNHTRKTESCVVVESWIAKANDPTYNEGAWIATVRVDDDALWNGVKSGEFNAFSFDVMAYKKNAVVEVLINPVSVGETEETNGHTHLFFARMNDDGKVVSGRTSTVNGHAHTITRGTATEITDGHKHRFFVS